MKSYNSRYIAHSIPSTKVIKCDYYKRSCPQGVGRIMKKIVKN